MERWRVAIIGCGNIGRAHARAWLKIPERVELVAISDSSQEALDEAGAAWGVAEEHRYLDFRALLDQERPDIVSICSWHGQHATMTIAAAARKPRAILCEKPMATSLREADEMIVAAQRNGVKLAIGHMRRFLPSWDEARQLIAAGVIGRPERLWSSVSDGLLNWGTHTVDAMRFLLGDPPAQWVVGSVQRETDRYERNLRIEDSCLGLIQFAGAGNEPGPQATIQMDLGAERHWQVVGSDGIVEARTARVRVLDSKDSGWRELDGARMTSQDAFNAQAVALVDWVDGTTTAYRSEAANARATLELLFAVYESARMHEVTRLPLRTLENPLDLMVESGQLPVLRPGRYDLRANLVRGEAMRWE